jgi:hypothetical protein
MAANQRPEDETEGPVVELTVDPETVCFLIVKAREFDVKVEPDDPDPGSNPADDGEVDVLEDRRDDPTFAELMGTLEALNDDELSELVAMTWIGRGDYDAEDWEEAKEQALQRGTKGTAEYLLGTPLLGDYLESGFTDLGYSCEETDEEHL